jgi:hypothetical protein
VYTNIPGRPLQYATTVLACLAFVVTVPIYVFYKKGPVIRARSKFAQSLDENRQKSQAQRKKSLAGSAGMKAGTEKEEREHAEHV